MISILFGAALAQGAEDPWQTTTFVIAASEKAYPAAVRKAAELAAATGIRFDPRGVGFDPSHLDAFGGLTFSAEDCRSAGFDYPCYVSRGRHTGNTTYISVERTDAFKGLTPDLYVVVAAMGDQPTADAALARVKAHVPDAYAKRGQVYQGCMH